MKNEDRCTEDKGDEIAVGTGEQVQEGAARARAGIVKGTKKDDMGMPCKPLYLD